MSQLELTTPFQIQESNCSPVSELSRVVSRAPITAPEIGSQRAKTAMRQLELATSQLLTF